MTKLVEEMDPSAAGMEGRPAPASIERMTACLAAVLPILQRLEANRQGAEKEAKAKYLN